MSDNLPSEFFALRRQLEAAAHPPDFSAIWSARRRRTRGWVAASVATVVVLSAATVLGLGAARANPPEVVGSPPVPTTAAPTPSTGPAPTLTPTPTVSTTPSGTPDAMQPSLVAMAAAPSGTLFGISQACVKTCDTNPVVELSLVRSTDQAAHWTKVSKIPGAGPLALRLLVADDSSLWVKQYGDVYGSTNGGRNWQRWSLGQNPFGPGNAAVAGGTAWVIWAGRLIVATGGGRPASSVGHYLAVEMSAVFPVDGNRAYVVDSRGTWLFTPDRGTGWSVVTDPCAGTPGEASASSRLGAAANGTLWLICAGLPTDGQQPKRLRVSTDGGGLWSDRGGLELTGYDQGIYPVSSTVAWRTGEQSPIYRTTDGTTWKAVAAPVGGPATFVAIDATTALYTETVDSGGRTVFVTRDGGRTWTRRPFSP